MQVPKIQQEPYCVSKGFSPCRFEDGLKLVKIRGESMQAAADARPSGMVSVIGLDSDKASDILPAQWSSMGP